MDAIEKAGYTGKVNAATGLGVAYYPILKDPSL